MIFSQIFVFQFRFKKNAQFSLFTCLISTMNWRLSLPDSTQFPICRFTFSRIYHFKFSSIISYYSLREICKHAPIHLFFPRHRSETISHCLRFIFEIKKPCGRCSVNGGCIREGRGFHVLHVLITGIGPGTEGGIRGGST